MTLAAVRDKTTPILPFSCGLEIVILDSFGFLDATLSGRIRVHLLVNGMEEDGEEDTFIDRSREVHG
jgi:hypothetical protein